jgi:hypothetical protein
MFQAGAPPAPIGEPAPPPVRLLLHPPPVAPPGSSARNPLSHPSRKPGRASSRGCSRPALRPLLSASLRRHPVLRPLWHRMSRLPLLRRNLLFRLSRKPGRASSRGCSRLALRPLLSVSLRRHRLRLLRHRMSRLPLLRRNPLSHRSRKPGRASSRGCSRLALRPLLSVSLRRHRLRLLRHRMSRLRLRRHNLLFRLSRKPGRASSRGCSRLALRPLLSASLRSHRLRTPLRPRHRSPISHRPGRESSPNTFHRPSRPPLLLTEHLRRLSFHRLRPSRRPRLRSHSPLRRRANSPGSSARASWARCRRVRRFLPHFRLHPAHSARLLPPAAPLPDSRRRSLLSNSRRPRLRRRLRLHLSRRAAPGSTPACSAHNPGHLHRRLLQFQRRRLIPRPGGRLLQRGNRRCCRSS